MFENFEGQSKTVFVDKTISLLEIYSNNFSQFLSWTILYKTVFLFYGVIKKTSNLFTLYLSS